MSEIKDRILKEKNKLPNPKRTREKDLSDDTRVISAEESTSKDG